MNSLLLLLSCLLVVAVYTAPVPQEDEKVNTVENAIDSLHEMVVKKLSEANSALKRMSNGVFSQDNATPEPEDENSNDPFDYFGRKIARKAVTPKPHDEDSEDPFEPKTVKPRKWQYEIFSVLNRFLKGSDKSNKNSEQGSTQPPDHDENSEDPFDIPGKKVQKQKASSVHPDVDENGPDPFDPPGGKKKDVTTYPEVDENSTDPFDPDRRRKHKDENQIGDIIPTTPKDDPADIRGEDELSAMDRRGQHYDEKRNNVLPLGTFI